MLLQADQPIRLQYSHHLYIYIYEDNTNERVIYSEEPTLDGDTCRYTIIVLIQMKELFIVRGTNPRWRHM